MPAIRQHPLFLLPTALIGLALLVFLGYFVIYNVYAVALFQFPFDYDQGEGFELVDTLLFSQGEWPYRDNDRYPFYSSNYPPVFHLVTAPLVWLFGPHYWTGRLVGYLGTLVTAAAIGWAVWRQGRRWWLAVLSGLAFLASNYVYHVGPLFRQHMFMVMFETLAVVWLTHTLEREETDGRRYNWRLLGVMVLLLLAGYTKQLAYATVVAVFAFWALRQTRRAIAWAIPFAAVTALLFFAINWATHGEWFIATVTANVNRFVPGQALGLFRQWFQLHTLLVIISGAYLIYQLYLERLSAYSLWFACATLNSVTAGKWGAGESYFATAIAASCLVTGVAFSRLLNGLQTDEWRRARPRLSGVAVWLALTVIPLLFLWQAGKVYHMPTRLPWLRATAQMLGKPTETFIAPQTSCSAPRPPEAVPYVDSVGPTLLGRPPEPADTQAGMEIVRLIAAGQTPAFSEEAGFNLRIGRTVVTNPTQLLNLYQNNQVNLSEMLDMLDRQAFDTVVLRAQFYPPPVLDMIGQRYTTTHLVPMNGFVYCVLQPRR